MEKLPNDLSGFFALVVYIHHKIISDGALKTFDAFVSNGGGILGVHTATASFKQQRHYFEILGGRFTGHGPVETFEVRPVSESNIFAGIPAFTVKDELYIHEFQPGNDVHFTANHEGQDVPAVWTRQYGKGRVCYTVPGHTTASMRNKTYQKVLQRGLTWVCNA
jgi:type 1 glutamine amidotransferase